MAGMVRFEDEVKRRRLSPQPKSRPGRDHGIMAERVGFEPTVEFPQHTLSKRAP